MFVGQLIYMHLNREWANGVLQIVLLDIAHRLIVFAMGHQLMVHLSLLLQQRLHAQHEQQPEQHKPLLKMILGQKDVGQLPYMLLNQEWMNGA